MANKKEIKFWNDSIQEISKLNKPVVSDNADETKCQSCGNNNDTDELHSCPYKADICNDETPCCNCCDNCCNECAMDI